MNETKWLAGLDGETMLDFVADRLSPRQWVLLSAATVRKLWDLYPDGILRQAVDNAERVTHPLSLKERTDWLGKIGVIVGLESSGKTDELVPLGRLVAMHIAASNPQAVESSGLDPAVVAREKEVLADKFRQQGKPDNVIAKIVESGLKTFYKEVCLLEQPYVHDDKKTVAQALKEAEGKVGGPIKVTAFVRYALGEGIEKQESDFAAEVAAASGQK